MSNIIAADHVFDHLSCCKKDPDVILVIEETEIPAHRAILSERCEYFSTMFSSSFVEAKSDKIILKETNLLAFKVILNFIYTGEFSTLYHDDTHPVTLDQLFEVLQCARYYMMDDLVKDTISRLKLKWSPTTTGLLLNNALSYSVDELIPYSTELIQKDAQNLVENKIFKQLTPMALEHVLKHRLDTYESIVFEALVSWMRSNPDYSEIFPKLLENVELHLLDKAQLDMLFKPTQLIDPLFLETLLTQQRQAQTVQKVIDQNVINADDLRIIDGTKNRIYVRRNIGEPTLTPFLPKGSIVIDLKQPFLLNCLKIDSVLADSFTVSVSRDTCEWECIIAFSKYECKGSQVLYFKEVAVRFLRIQSDADHLHISTDIEAMYSTAASSYETDSDIALIVPNYNIMPAQLSPRPSGHTVGTWMGGTFWNGSMKQYVNSGVIYQFRYSYLVENLELLFKDETSYYVEIANAKRQWTRVKTEENVSGWRLATFGKQPVMYIKVVGTKACDSHFYLRNIRCPATERP